MRTRIMAISILAWAVLTLSSCGPAEVPEEAGFVPSSCELPDVIQAFDQRLEGAAFIPTEWQPAEGTDLFDVYEAGGIACTYGIESAEIGGTVMWARANDDFWIKKSSEWAAAGHKAVDIPDLDEDEAYVFETVSADDQAVWYINFHINGVWVQFGASKFITGMEDATAIIQAAAKVTSNS